MNTNVFNSEIHLVTFVLIVFVFLNLIALLLLKNKLKSKNYYKFLFLLFAILLNNISSGLLPDVRFGVNLLSQNILAYTIGLITTIYYYYYIHSVYKIQLFLKVRPSLIFMIFLLVLIVGFILPYTMTGNLYQARKIFIVTPLIAALLLFVVFVYYGVRDLKKNNSLLANFNVLSGIMGIASIMSLPFVIYIFGDNQPLEQFAYTFGLFFLIPSYYLSIHLYKDKDLKFILTAREVEIFNLVVENPTLRFVDLCQKIHISESTFTSHMSKIYKKVQVQGLREFKERFKKSIPKN
ncbi:hypothetical protein ETU09_04730 [Apibacter muscae]|uniref:HTH luxR-type domain-containing protein n=1 Tax=Apibacter muscae TaxID=2509004 RepID=A0A563DG54_9FLAO|nr:hypothetical protein [Apibacter muscae]TWP29150.1 hypothetical protein ETU09_04730 [Apibacter muscae]